MSTEFPKTEATPAETKYEKMARLRAELATLEEPEAPAAPEAQAEIPTEAVQEQAAETATAPDPAAVEHATADAAALVATKERLGIVEQKAEAPAEVSSAVMGLLNGHTRAYGARTTRETVNKLDIATQETLAQDFFDKTIGGGEMPVLGSLQEQYQVYKALSGTAFAEKFKMLEDARLKKYGYGGFSGNNL